MQEIQLLGICNPLLDLTVTGPAEFLEKYNLKKNDAILADEAHKDLAQDLANSFPVKFSPGGFGQNTTRIAQKFLPSQSRAFVGCIGDD